MGRFKIPHGNAVNNVGVFYWTYHGSCHMPSSPSIVKNNASIPKAIREAMGLTDEAEPTLLLLPIGRRIFGLRLPSSTREELDVRGSIQYENRISVPQRANCDIIFSARALSLLGRREGLDCASPQDLRRYRHDVDRSRYKFRLPPA
jgi:hypothetical protein